MIMANNTTTQTHNPLTIEQYIELRLDAQQSYHSVKAGEFQTKHIRLSRTQIILAALIPVVAILDPTEHDYLQLLTGIIGATIAIIGGFMSLGNYQQNWMSYRTTSEALKAEKFKFLVRCGEYSDGTILIAEDEKEKDAAKEHILMCRLQSNVEKIISNQNDQWQQQRREQEVKRQKEFKAAQK